MKKKIGLAVAAVAAVLVVLGLMGAGDIIDLPEWANVPGVDLPIVGDTDQIDCKLSKAAISGLTGDEPDPYPVEIKIVDGDKATYGQYMYVWNNGNLLDEGSIIRLDDELLHVIPNNIEPEQFFSISIEPVREGRVFCESIILE